VILLECNQKGYSNNIQQGQMMLSILLFVACAKMTNPEPVISPVEEEMVKVVVNQEQLKESIGQVVQIEGITQRMKAGSAIQFEGIEIWCIGIDWEDSGKKVRVKGVLSRGSSPMRAFPIATQDENGEWSQGIQGDTDTSIGLDSDDSSKPETTSEIVKPTPADWLITVEAHNWIE
jgi:hypothetical protein